VVRKIGLSTPKMNFQFLENSNSPKMPAPVFPESGSLVPAQKFSEKIFEQCNHF